MELLWIKSYISTWASGNAVQYKCFLVLPCIYSARMLGLQVMLYSTTDTIHIGIMLYICNTIRFSTDHTIIIDVYTCLNNDVGSPNMIS